MNLNDEQKKVVYTNERFLFLLASAGSGKTRVITERIKYLINQGISPDRILAITFTRKAALEMKKRTDNEDVHIHTFHQFCFIKLNEVGNEAFKIVEEEQLPFSKTELLKVAKYKNSVYKKSKPMIYDVYQNYLYTRGMKDFDDLLLDYYRYIKSYHNVSVYDYIFIDEFQDTNDLQYVLLKRLIHKNTHVLAVGDPDQSIYQFRGANSKIIYRYIKDYQAKLMLLSVNYRSSQIIITHANRLIRRNNRKYHKEMITFNKTKDQVFHIAYPNEIEEALSLFKIIRKELSENKEVAVLFRNHHRAYELKKVLLENDIAIKRDDEIDFLDKSVQMMTIHKAKGLEFEVVIIIGLEQGVLPSFQQNSQLILEEERRLMFVAMTRARKVLYFSSIQLDDRNHSFTYSQFIRESGVKTIKSRQLNDIISLGDFNEH